MKLGMWLVALCLAGCGGHSGPPTYSISGQVSGLSVGSSLMLTNNGQDALTVSANGTFTFSTAVPSGSAYSIAVSSQPSSHTQYCTISDGVGTLSAASVTSVSVVCVTAMTLTTTTATTAENELVTGQLTATDASGAAVSFAKASDPKHGAVTVEANGTATYTPAAYFYGTDTYAVGLTDTNGATASGVVTVTVTYVNYPPVAQNDRLRIASATTVLPILANDTNLNHDALTVSILTQPAGGTVTVQNGSTVTFQPTNAFAGPTSFSYSITNPSSSSSQATVQLVVGDFPGIVLLSDETSVGTPEVHVFDGFQMVRISNPLPGGSSLAGFTLASDGRHLAYVVTGLNGSTVFVADVTAPGTAHAEYNSGSTNLGVTVNRDASELIITDPSNASTLKSSLIQSATGNATIIGASNPTVLQQLGMAFNPVSTEYYVTGQVGGSPPPMSGTGFTTLFAATTGTPDPLLQIGASYPANDGEGSGLELSSTPDGARILHVALTYNHSLPGNSSTFDLLVNDRATNSETYLYRKFGVFELMNVAGSTYAVSPDGTGVCFGLNQLPANASISTGQIWVADPRAPGSATAVTPVAAQNTNCQWAADSKTLVYRSATTGPTEPWVANVTHPGAVSRLREPMAPGDTLDYLGVSRLTMTAIAVVQAGGGASNFYRAALASPGTSVLFYSTSLPYYIATVGLDAAGTSLEMLQRVPLANSAGTMNQLHWVSTQVAGDDLVVNRTDTATGVLQAQFLSQ